MKREKPNLLLIFLGMGIMGLLIFGILQVEAIANFLLNLIFRGEELPLLQDFLTITIVASIFYLLYYMRENLVYDTFFQKVATSLFTLSPYVAFFFIFYILLRIVNSTS